MPATPPSKAALRRGRQWRKLLRAEAQARAAYSDQPTTRNRNRWLAAKRAWVAFGKAPSDAVLAALREEDRTDR